MKKIALCLAMLAALFAAGQSSAATTTTAPAKPVSAQNSRMKSCAAQYHQKNLPKSQYKTFMSGCLKNPATAAAPAAAPMQAVTPTAGPAPAAMAPSTMTPPKP